MVFTNGLPGVDLLAKVLWRDSPGDGLLESMACVPIPAIQLDGKFGIRLGLVAHTPGSESSSSKDVWIITGRRRGARGSDRKGETIDRELLVGNGWGRGKKCI